VFKKSGNKAEDQLAARLRQIAAKPALQDAEYITQPFRGDKRRTRRITFKQATLILSGGGKVDVVIKNVSDTGVRIEFFCRMTLTDKVIISEPSLRIRKWARVIWQTEGAAGLHFLED
jgi:hypothetical protein